MAERKAIETAQRIESVLEEFASLNCLQTFVRLTETSNNQKVHQKVPGVNHQNLMQKNLRISLVTSLRRTPLSTPMSSEHYRKKTSTNGLPGVVLKEMRRNTCADTNGLVAECFFYGKLDLHKCLLEVCLSMLAVGRIYTSWSHTVFSINCVFLAI